MTCYHPLLAFRHKVKKTSSGKSLIVFKPPEDYRSTHSPVSPWEEVYLPCGQCVGCRLERSRQWAVRCVHEASLHQHNVFVTLTYNDENVPWSETGEQTLVKRDHQLFMKRLRKAFPDKKIRFFMCGEYGEETNRPHYHYIIFGLDFSDKYVHAVNFRGDLKYRSPMLEKIWTKGNSEIAEVNFETCAYVARYIMKKHFGADADFFMTDLRLNSRVCQESLELPQIGLRNIQETCSLMTKYASKDVTEFDTLDRLNIMIGCMTCKIRKECDRFERVAKNVFLPILRNL